MFRFLQWVKAFVLIILAMQIIVGCKKRESKEPSQKGFNISHVQDENLEQVIIDNIEERMDSEFSNEEAAGS